MRIISTRLIPRVCGSIARSRRHSASSSAADLRGISLSRFSGFGISTSGRWCCYRTSSSGTRSFDGLADAARPRKRGDRMRRRLPPSARSSVISAAISRQALKRQPPLLRRRPAGVCFSHAGGAVNRRCSKKSWRHQLARPDSVRRRMRPVLARLPLREQT